MPGHSLSVVHVPLRSRKIGRWTCVLHNLPTMSIVQCNTQMQVQCLFLKNRANVSMVDLMACRGATFLDFSAYVTFSWPHRQKWRGLWSIATSWTSSISSIVKKTVYSASLSLSVSLFQTMLDNSPLDSGSRETLSFGAFPNIWLSLKNMGLMMQSFQIPHQTIQHPAPCSLQVLNHWGMLSDQYWVLC